MTEADFINIAYERLKTANPSADSSVIPRLRAALPHALEAASVRVARDRTLRNVLRRQFSTVTATAGVASLTSLQSGAQPILLDEMVIRTADIRHANGRLQMLADRASLEQERPTEWPYGAVEGANLYTRNTDGETDTLSGNLTITASYIETDIGDWPQQLNPILFEELFLAAGFAPAKAAA